jgi:hypothetical protein
MMIAGKVKSGDKIEVQVDKDGQAVFVINGQADASAEKPTEKKVTKIF